MRCNDFANQVNGSGPDLTITDTNYSGLKTVCQELEYDGFDMLFKAYEKADSDEHDDYGELRKEVDRLTRQVRKQERQLEHYKSIIADMQNQIKIVTNPSFMEKVNYFDEYMRTGCRPVRPGRPSSGRIPPLAKTPYNYLFRGDYYAPDRCC